MSQATAVDIWVIDHEVGDATFERLGDAAALAQKMHTQVGVLLVGDLQIDPTALFHRGADIVHHVQVTHSGLATRIHAAVDQFQSALPRLIFAGADHHSRAWASRLAIQLDSQLVSPALLVATRGDELLVQALDHTGKRSREVVVDLGRPCIVTMRPGVAQSARVDASRTGEFVQSMVESTTEPIKTMHITPADPATVDIRHAPRLIAGGRGLGSKQAFNQLRRVADKLNAGIAASRVTVDLGWIEYDRQVGQTGRTVKPVLYLACGISGASHHLAGMADAEHIIAINTDASAPIFKAAHLGLVGDLHVILDELQHKLTP